LDIKPDNVIQGESGKFHLVDFGLSSKTFADGVGYTNSKWSAPEQMKVVEADETSATDIFSIALTLAFALTGKHPWLPSLDMDYGQRLISKSADLTGVPEKYRHWIMPALAKEPKNRPSAQELLHELDVISGDEEFVKPEGSEIRTWLELEAQLGVAFVNSLEFECQVNTSNKGSWVFELHQTLDEGKYLILRSADNPPSAIRPSNLNNIGKLGWRISHLNSNERVVRLDNFDESNFDAIKLIIATLRSGFSISIENIQAVSFF
jgi:serine/threonine protein kinase